MSFHDFMFPPETTLYPPAAVMQQYVLDYAEHFGLRRFIRLNTRVEQAIWNGKEWEVRISGKQEVLNCDHLIMANGHYRQPYSPSYPGLREWSARQGHSAVHSTYYREPSAYVGKKVLIVGGGPSGRDISAEIASVASEAYHSVRSFQRDDTTNPKQRPEIASFDPEGDGAVRYVDGAEDRGVDAIVWATGFELE